MLIDKYFIYLFTSTKSTTECYKYYKHIIMIFAFNQQKALVGDFSVIVKSFWTFIASFSNNIMMHGVEAVYWLQHNQGWA